MYSHDKEGAFQLRGVVEGFYGRVWSMPERKQLVSSLASKGLNHYIYAPKDDPKHRTKWRDSYSRSELDEFRDLISFLSDKDVQFNFALSPGADLSLYDERAFRSDVENLANKYVSIIQLGCKNLTLLLDEVVGEGEQISGAGKKLTLGDAQVRLCEELNKRVAELVKEKVEKAPPRIQWYFLPTHFCGDFQGTADDAPVETKQKEGKKGKRNELKDSTRTARKKLQYWREITKLPPSWIFFLTGTSPVSPTITTHFGMALQRFWKKRKIVLWDNYPVNDYRPQILYLHAYEGREGGLKDYIEGVVANPMEKLESSLIPLATVLDYLSNPLAYDPQISLKNALMDLFGSQMAEEMFNLIQCAPPSTLRSRAALDELRRLQAREGKKYFLDQRSSLNKVVAFLNPSAGGNEKGEAAALKTRRRATLAEELRDFFVLQRLYLDMNISTYELNEALASTSLDALDKVVATKQELTRIQRELDQLLFPSRPAKLLRDRMEEINRDFCV